ncbi:hypothetical protein ANN_14541 [Periplaneta americana]|uniref:DUF4817 domain-containing protein n=1 Tax=Periplaneta americana TaxID=6978 RepID=A0ABQ8SWL2_PERAM|nr:hypothetical protein ANN_14541 [Periplaneta americana]
MDTIPERVEMVLIHAGGLSLREAAEEYHRRHPDQPIPHHRSIGRLMERFKTAGSIHDKIRSGRPRTATGDANTASVLAKLVVSPSRSSREVAQECGTSQASVSRILSVNHFHSYRMHFVQELHGDDTDMRVQFCE